MAKRNNSRRASRRGGLSKNMLALIVLSAALVLVIIALVVLILVKNGQGEKKEESSVASAPITVEAQTEEPTAEPVVTDVSFGSSDYSEDFFSNDLFIGDSIATGFTDYSKLPEKNVAADVNLTPYKAHAEDIALADGTTGTALSYAEQMQPDRIFLMMGFNGLNSPNAMEGSFKTLIEKLEAACPDSVIYCYSITPLTADSSAAASAGYDNTNVDSFNTYLKQMTSEMGVVYLDINSKMSDSNGCLKADYNEYDGMHISAPTYDLILSYTQRYIEETPVPEASSKHAPVPEVVSTTAAEGEASTPEEASSTAEQASASTTEAGSESEGGALTEDYSASFFSNDLFIGDSITTGLSLYGILPAKNVAAAVGYTPYKAYSEEMQLGDGTTGTALSYAEKMQPTRIFIMLGSNGITSAASMEDSYSQLLDKLAAACPDSEIYCISVTPVTSDSSSAASAGIDNSMITEFNEFIKSLAEEKGVTYIDLYSQLSDSSGYFMQDYAETDGLHFKSVTYKLMLGYIEGLID